MKRASSVGHAEWIAGLLASLVGLACTTPAPPVRPVTENVAALPESRSRPETMGELPVARDDRPARGIRRVSCAQQVELRSLTGDRETVVSFVNHRSSSVSIYWLDYQGRPVHYMDLGPDERYRQPTYVTHPWLVVAQGRGEGCVGLYIPTAQGEHTIDIDET